MTFRLAAIVFAAYVFVPSTAYAYIDPGLVSMVIQGLFAAVAGFTAVYVLGPWRWFKSLFTRSKPPANPETKATSEQDN